MRSLITLFVLFLSTPLFPQEDYIRHCTDACRMSSGSISILTGEFEATSCLSDKKNPSKYCPEKAFDNNLETSWAEGKNGQGLNEKLAFHIKKKIKLSS